MKKLFVSFIAKLMALVLVFSAVPVFTGAVAADEFAYGDVNEDTIINAEDALEVLKFSAKLIEFGEMAYVLADVDDNGDITARDALLILQYAAGLINEFPVNGGEVTDTPADPTATPETPADPTATPEVTEDAKFESFPIEVITAGNIADVDGTTITFKHPSNSADGVLLDNPFAGKDTSKGLAISFWLRSSETISGANYTFRSLITAMRENNLQAIKFDLEGTRQLATVDGDKLNYWEASSAFLQVDEEYFITLTINENGLEYYVDGYSIGVSGFGGVNESTAYDTAMALLSLEGTTLYAGGVSSADALLQGDARIYDHKIPEGTVMSDITGYIGNMTESDVEDLYLSVSENHIPIPTVGPTTAPTATPEPTATPAPTDDLTPTPPPTATPEVSADPTPTPDSGEIIPFSGRFIIAGDSIADGVEGTDAIGWGDVVYENFTSDVTVRNEAHLGDSCLSYFYDWDGNGDSHGRWQNAYWCESWKDHSHNQCTHDSDDDHLGKDDYILISFGHNDANTAANRYASATAPTTEKGSFKWWLKEKYIDPALSVGAVPILMTPIVRCTYDSNGKFTETATHLSYGQAMRDLVAEYAANGIEIILIDAQQYTYDYLSNTTFAEASKLYASGATSDITHMNAKGAAWLADYVTSELAKLPLGINQYIK